MQLSKGLSGVSEFRNGVPSYTVFEAEMVGANSPITSLSTDSLGRLVAASGSKLIVFDGTDWSSYLQATSSGEDALVVYSTITGPDGRMYCASDKGLHRIKFIGNQQYIVEDIANGDVDLQKSRFTAINHAFTLGKEVYFYGLDRTVRFDTETGSIDSNALNRQFTSNLIPFKGDIVEFGTNEYIYVHKKNGEFDRIDTNRGRIARLETRVATVWRGTVYLGHDTGMSVINNGNIEPWNSEIEDLASQNISGLIPLSDEYLAVSVRSQGIYILNSQGQIVQSLDRQMDHRFGILGNFLYAGNGVVWANLDESLVRVDFLSPLTTFSSLLPYATQYPKLFFHNGSLHLATDGKLLETQYYKGGGLKGFRNLLPNHKVDLHSAISTDEGIVFTDYHGIFLLKDSGELEKVSDHSEVNVVAKLKTQPPVLISAGRESFQLIEKRDGKWTFTGQSQPAPERSFYSVSPSDGSVWFEHGTARVSRLKIQDGKLTSKSFGRKDGLNNAWINIWEYQNNVYFSNGTGMGLLVWDEEFGKFEKLSKGFLEPLERISESTRPSEDSFGNLWVPTVSSSHPVLRMSDSGEVIEDTATLAALIGEEMIQAVPANAGSMWLVGRDELFRYDPNLAKEEIELRPTKIYQVEQVGDHRVLYDSRLPANAEKIVVPYRNNSIRIHLTNPSIGYTKSVLNQYMVKGQSESWSTLPTSNSLFLSNLVEGSYEVLIRPTYDGAVFGGVSSISFEVLPPFYRTLWAYAGYVLVLVFGLWGLVHFLKTRADALNKTLQALVHERTKGLDKANRDLTEMYEKVKATDQAKGNFLATVSHEMRTPLNAIIGPSQLLLEESPSELQFKFLTMINNAGSHLLGFIDDVLEFTSSGSRHRELVIERFNLRKLVVELTDSVAVKGREKGLAIDCKFDSCVPEYWKGDKKVFSQILSNLLNNAFKFTESGGVEVSVSMEESNKGATCVLVEILDTGVGIPESARELVFEPFQQVENTFTRHYDGAGLGLSICRQLVAQMNGSIDFESELGKGTKFWVSIPMFPIYETIVETVDEPKAFGEAELLPKRVLVADDNLSNRVIAAEILEKMNCKVDHAVNGEEAVRKAIGSKYDLILMDIRMPVMNGIDASSHIRKGENPNRKTPIIALSAFLSKSLTEECEEMGIDFCLNKPVSMDELRNAVFSTFAEAG